MPLDITLSFEIKTNYLAKFQQLNVVTLEKSFLHATFDGVPFASDNSLSISTYSYFLSSLILQLTEKVHNLCIFNIQSRKKQTIYLFMPKNLYNRLQPLNNPLSSGCTPIYVINPKVVEIPLLWIFVRRGTHTVTTNAWYYFHFLSRIDSLAEHLCMPSCLIPRLWKYPFSEYLCEEEPML